MHNTEIGQTYSLKDAKINKLRSEDMSVHDWYRFVLAFPPHLVDDYINRFSLDETSLLLDPFCGTGTTLVQAKLRGILSIGVEVHPLAFFAAQVKLDWDIAANELLEHSRQVAENTMSELQKQGIEDSPLFLTEKMVSYQELRNLPDNLQKLLLANSISPLPLHKTLVLLEQLEKNKSRFFRHQLLALAKALVASVGNLKFGPEVGIGRIKDDAPVVSVWLNLVKNISQDLAKLSLLKETTANVFNSDSRQSLNMLKSASVTAVITSPPYPNEKDYTRINRLESVLLGFINNKDELQKVKKSLLCSNTRNVYKENRADEVAQNNLEVQTLATQIETKRIMLGKTSGFERLYSRVVQLYFGGMTRHLSNLRPLLRPEAQLAYVVGDQASFFRIPIPTGQLIARIAEDLGYTVKDIEVFRTRFSTATKQYLKEEVVVLRWQGK
jgi:DNA modification methylase